MESFDINKVRDFLDAAMEATKDCNYAEFQCPLCEKTAHAGKASINGHVHAACDGCGMNFMQ